MSKITDENNIKENYMKMLNEIYESLNEKKKNNKVIKFNFKKGFKISNGLISNFQIPFEQIVKEYYNFKLPKTIHDRIYNELKDSEKNNIIDNYCSSKRCERKSLKESKLNKVIMKYISDNYKADFKRKILSHIKSVFKNVFKSDPLYLGSDDKTSSFECNNVSESKLKQFLLNYVKIYLICDNCKTRKISFKKDNRSLEFYCNNCKSTFYGSNLIKKFKVEIQC